MTSKEPKRMLELCEQMQLEKDSHKLGALADELNRLLTPATEPKIQHQGTPGGRPERLAYMRTLAESLRYLGILTLTIFLRRRFNKRNPRR